MCIYRNSACTWLQWHRQKAACKWNRALTNHKKKKKKKRKRKQSTHNILASHRAHLWTFSSTSHRTHRVKTSKHIHIEHIESDQEKKKKNNALTTKKKGKIEREYSQIETVQLGYFFSYREAVEVEVEEKWRRR